MRKTNNKFRRNGGNTNHSSNSPQIHSLNYRFDSNSIGGKFSDTALNLIKKYNDLARDALNHSDRVSAEVFKQYAEHYRKILTDINETRNETKPEVRSVPKEEDANLEKNVSFSEEKSKKIIPTRAKRELKIVEIKEDSVIEKPKRVYRRKTTSKESQAEVV